MIDLVSQLLFIEAKTQLMNLLNKNLQEYKYCKEIMKKHFNKSLIMTEEEEFISKK